MSNTSTPTGAETTESDQVHNGREGCSRG
jgi:hypothetical protein